MAQGPIYTGRIVHLPLHIVMELILRPVPEQAPPLKQEMLARLLVKSTTTEEIVKFTAAVLAVRVGIRTPTFSNAPTNFYPLGNKGVFYGSLFPGTYPGFLLTNFLPIHYTICIMNKILFTAVLCLLAQALSAEQNAQGKVKTQRGASQYLSVDPLEVTDSCPGGNIMQPFTCTKDQPDGFSCFDVSIVQGDPIPTERYELLDETLQPEDVSAEPQCLNEEPTCDSFLKYLNYNLDFSWFIANFPSSSFPECGKTYTCTRIVCYFPPDKDAGQTASQKLSCVYKKHQRFFVGSEVTCTRTFKGQTLPPTPKKITQTASSLSL